MEADENEEDSGLSLSWRKNFSNKTEKPKTKEKDKQILLHNQKKNTKKW